MAPMADEDIHEVFLIPAERQTDCLVCADRVDPLLAMLLSGSALLCFRHLAELTRRADAADGSHLSLAPEPVPAVLYPSWPEG